MNLSAAKNSGGVEEMSFVKKKFLDHKQNRNYMKHEPQPFANLDGVLVVKAIVRSANLGDRGVAHLAQCNLEINRLVCLNTHGIVIHIKPGQRRIGAAHQNTQTFLNN
jgi:hypothetical protein